MREKNFGLSEEEFGRLERDLKKNDTRFFEQVFLAQFEETKRFLMHTVGADPDTAYDAAMDALLAFRRRFVAGKLAYGNLRFLFTQMAKQQLLRNRRIPGQEIDLAMDPIEPPPKLGNEEEKVLEQAWQDLDTVCRSLLTWHYYGKMKLNEIAEQEGQSPSTIRKRKERCVKKLKEYFRIRANVV